MNLDILIIVAVTIFLLYFLVFILTSWSGILSKPDEKFTAKKYFQVLWFLYRLAGVNCRWNVFRMIPYGFRTLINTYRVKYNTTPKSPNDLLNTVMSIPYQIVDDLEAIFKILPEFKGFKHDHNWIVVAFQHWSPEDDLRTQSPFELNPVQYETVKYHVKNIINAYVDSFNSDQKIFIVEANDDLNTAIILAAYERLGFTKAAIDKQPRLYKYRT